MAWLATALWSSELGNAGAFSIGTRIQARRALEQTAEERGVFVADAPADLIDWSVRPLEPRFRTRDAQPLYVGNRGNAGGAREPSLEGAFGQ